MPDEYISREAALKALFAPGMCYAPMQLQIIKDLPAADVAEVVRCKYCRHPALTQRYGVPGTLTCHNRYSPCNRRNVGGEDFCSYGERREE